MLTKSITAALIGVVVLQMPAQSQNPGAGSKFSPKLEAIADTKLLMDGIVHSNFRGLEKLLAQKNPDAQGWTFARGQALLIAEAGNLLMLRPPKTQGQQAWFERAMELRSLASQLGQVVARKDLERSRMGLRTLANSCNRCHQTFRVNVDITPFEDEAPPRKL